MMKKIKILITSIVMAAGIPFILQAQQDAMPLDEFNTTIAVGGRYVPGTGIELRYFPEKRVVMETGFRDGFIIERSTGDTGTFEEIARLRPYSEAEWDAAMEVAEEESLDMLDLARAFLDMAMTPRGGTFGFDEGISDMRRQRADEEFEHAVFVLTAARDAGVAEALAMSYTDSEVEAGQTYIYRVRTVTDPPIYNLVPAPTSIRAVFDEQAYDNEVYFYEGDTWINFVWEEDGNLSLYEIKRRDAGSEEFVLINDAPRLNLRGSNFDAFKRGSFRDEGLINYQPYTYRFYGYNMFGERILFAEVEAMPRDRTPPEQPRILNVEHHKPREVLLEWEMNTPPAPDLMGFVIGRAPSLEDGFQIIHPELIPGNTRSFIDTSFVEGQLNYYVVQAVDTAFNVSSSLPVAVTLIDTIPPEKPVWVSGTVDSLGVVTLEVQKNPEADLMGYRLFKGNDPAHEFSVIHEGFVVNDSLRHEIPVVFTDTITLNSLTPRVYYKVKALDFNFNQSEDSELMVIERPDTIPPTTPVFKRVISSRDKIALHFALSESHDVVSHTLYRNTGLDLPWEAYAPLDNSQLNFTDDKVEQGITYYYSIRALDNSGLYSDFARPVFGKAYDDGTRPPVENLSLAIEEERGTLSWSYPLAGDHVFFVVYKEDERGRLLQHIRTNELSVSENIGPEESPRYAVKAFTTDGGESPLSAVIGD